jgi:hypothetical protein
MAGSMEQALSGDSMLGISIAFTLCDSALAS